MFNRERLETSISYATKKIKNKGNQSEYIDMANSAIKNHVPPTRIKALVSGTMPLQNIPVDQLYYLADFLIQSKVMDGNISDYFSQTEINSFILNNNIEPIPDKSVVRFENVLKSIVREEYTCKLTYKELAIMYKYSLIGYNIETQRVSKIKKRNFQVFKIPNINQGNIEAMKKEMLDGKFESNTITLNIRKTGSECYQYTNSGELVVELTVGETFIDVIDGWHRISAIYEAYCINPDIIGDMTITIKNLDIDQARMFIIQESKGAINNQVGIELYDSNNNIVKLINDINIFGNADSNFLYNKFSTPNFVSESSIIPFEIMAKNMNISWSEILNKSDVRKLIEIKRYIIDFYNIFVEELKEKYKAKSVNNLIEKITILNDPMFLSGLVITAYTLYAKSKAIDDAVMAMPQIITKINFKQNEANLFIYENEEDKKQFKRYCENWMKVSDD